MAQVSSNVEQDPNSIVLTSLSLTAAETTTETTQLPTLPFDVLPEILCRLPVKLLVQLRCLCKFFNSLVSDPKFAKKHLQFSTKRHHLMLECRSISCEVVLYDSPIPSVFSTSTVVAQTQLYPPDGPNRQHCVNVLCSCDGIFCVYVEDGSFFLWNPSIRKFKLLPPLENPHKGRPSYLSLGYDHFIDNYKLIRVSSKNEVSVYTLGTDYWTRIDDIPYSYYICGPGVFVSGTANWLVTDDSYILSLDLKKESYQQLLLPDFVNDIDMRDLRVLKDCLCFFASCHGFLDVWIMNEYGNKESWTKLYSFPNMQDRGFNAYNALYISEDDQMLLECYEMGSYNNRKLVVYDSKTGTSNIPEFQNNYQRIYPHVYIESLISP